MRQITLLIIIRGSMNLIFKRLFITATLFLLSGCGSPEKSFLALCESQIKNMIATPSSYNRISYNVIREDIDREEFINNPEKYGEEISEDRKSILRQLEVTPIVFRMVIEFDAANAYGTPIRKLVSCEYFSQFGELDGVSRINMTINGKTEHERLIDEFH